MPAESLLPAALGVTLFLIPALALFFGGLPDRPTAVARVAGLLASLGIATAEWLLLGSSVDVALFQAALCTAGVAIVLSRLAPGFRSVVFVLALLVTVVVPVAFSLFDVQRGPIVVVLGTLDFGGVASLALVPGAAAVAVALVGGVPAAEAPLNRPVWLFPLIAIATVVGFTCASLGGQLVFDDLSGELVRNAVLAAVSGSVGWTIAQVINVHRASGAGAVAGVIAGSLVILPASPWLNALSVVVLALLAGILGHVCAVATRRGRCARWATVMGVCLLPGVLGMLGSGVVASGSGMLLSGHIDLLQAQAVGLLVVLLCALLVSALLALLLLRRRPKLVE